MRTTTAFDRGLAITAAVSFGILLLLFLVAPGGVRVDVVLGNVGWTWMSGLALLAALRAWRRAGEPSLRAAWGTAAVALGLDFTAQLVADWFLFGAGAKPAPPSPDDLLFIAVPPILLLAAWRFLRRDEREGVGVEVALDTALLTLIVAGLAAEYWVVPFRQAGLLRAEQILRVLYVAGGVAIFWLVLVRLLQQLQFPRRTVGLAIAGIVVYGITNAAQGITLNPPTYTGGDVFDLGWHAAMALLAIAGSLAPARPSGDRFAAAPTPVLAPRFVVLMLGFAGLAWVGARLVSRPEPGLARTVFVVLGTAVLAARLGVALLADRRYARRLEAEVRRQTLSLSDSLLATATAERELRQLMEAVPDAIVVLDSSGRLLDVNTAARGMGRPSAEPGRSVYELVGQDEAAVVRTNLARAFAGEVVTFEAPFTRADGSAGAAAVSYAPVRQRGVVTKVIALARDVTEQRRTESQLQRAERLAALGQLVSGVAHEINNPAAIISGFAQTLLLEPLSGEQREMSQMIYDEAIRIGGITSNLLAFARTGAKARSLVDVNEVVRRTAALRAYQHSTMNIATTLDLDPTAPLVLANGAELQQVLLNLVINAEQALADGAAPRTLHLHTASDERNVRIVCADSGPGMTPDVQSRVFDPFYTTRPAGSGTGLGLSICFGIVRDYGGEITLESAPGKGAAFTVRLPRDVGVPASAEPRAPAPAPATATPRVLLVEDEANFRSAAVRYFERRGIPTRSVADGAAALAAISREHFDIVVTDVRMPGMSAREFVDRLRVDWPVLARRLIVATGDPGSAETVAVMESTGAPLIEKPFGLEELETLIRRTAAKTGA